MTDTSTTTITKRAVAGSPVWENPPLDTRAKYDWAAIFAPFLENPEVWGIAYTFDGASKAETAVSNLRKGRVKDLPPGDWEFKAIKEGSISHLYVKYKGGNDQPDRPRTRQAQPMQPVDIEPGSIVWDPPEGPVPGTEILTGTFLPRDVIDPPAWVDPTPEVQVDPPEADQPPNLEPLVVADPVPVPFDQQVTAVQPIGFGNPVQAEPAADPFSLPEEAAADEVEPF